MLKKKRSRVLLLVLGILVIVYVAATLLSLRFFSSANPVRAFTGFAAVCWMDAPYAQVAGMPNDVYLAQNSEDTEDWLRALMKSRGYHQSEQLGELRVYRGESDAVMVTVVENGLYTRWILDTPSGEGASVI